MGGRLGIVQEVTTFAKHHKTYCIKKLQQNMKERWRYKTIQNKRQVKCGQIIPNLHDVVKMYKLRETNVYIRKHIYNLHICTHTHISHRLPLTHTLTLVTPLRLRSTVWALRVVCSTLRRRVSYSFWGSRMSWQGYSVGL